MHLSRRIETFGNDRCSTTTQSDRGEEPHLWGKRTGGKAAGVEVDVADSRCPPVGMVPGTPQPASRNSKPTMADSADMHLRSQSLLLAVPPQLIPFIQFTESH